MGKVANINKFNVYSDVSVECFVNAQNQNIIRLYLEDKHSHIFKLQKERKFIFVNKRHAQQSIVTFFIFFYPVYNERVSSNILNFSCKICAYFVSSLIKNNTI